MNKKTVALAISMALALASLCAAAGCSGAGKWDMSEEHTDEYFYDEDLFHDQSPTFMSPLQPTREDNVTIRLKTKRGLAQEVGIKYSFDLSAGETATFYTAPMVFECADDNLNYDYWVGIIPANSKYYRYHFELKNERERVWFDTEGVSDEEPADVSGDWYVLPGFEVPAWSQGAVWYSAMPDSFYNGNTLNDKTGSGIEDVWGGSVHSGMTDYFGGDLMGLLAQMDYLKGLNITSLFINPIWVTAHNAGYGQYDFFQIDSAYGNDSLFLEFVETLHEEDLKILCDAVIQYVNINNIIYNYTGMYPDLYGDKYDDAVQYDKNGNPSDSGWGGPMVDFSQKIARDYFYSSDESVLITYILKYAIDGWRMDVGNTLSGSDPAHWGNSTDILADIRKYIKAAGEDLLFLSEHAAPGQLTDGILDSKWNYAFTSAVESWVTGISNANVLANSLRSAVLSVPRPVANAMYNHLTSHDYQRLYDIVGGDDVKFTAAQLIQFTYVGSPVIYYGEEIGLSRPVNDYSDRVNSFDVSMNWDRSTWNYYLQNFTSSLASLRREYEDVYRFGAFADLYSAGRDNPHDVFAYARFEGGNACITLTNRNPEVVRDFELDVRLLSLADGTVLTDYLTGRQYTVQGGKVRADIYPAGSVLVTGKAGNTRGIQTLRSYGGTGSVTEQDLGVYTYAGEGSLGSRDDILFSSFYGFNNCAAEAELVSVDGSAVLMIRGADDAASPFYGVTIERDVLRRVMRSRAGGQAETDVSCTLDGVQAVRLERTDDNVFRTLVKRDGKWEEVPLFAAELPLGYETLLGVAPLSGSVTLAVRSVPLAEQTRADYESGLGSLALVKGDASKVRTGNGCLVLSGGERETFVLTQAHYLDFTQRAEISYRPAVRGSFGGLAVLSSESDYLVAGRYFDGTEVQLIVGQVIGGELCIYVREKDVSPEKIVLQFQRTASDYTALISADGETFRVLGTVRANYPELWAGLVCAGAEELAAEYWQFGDGTDGTLAAHYFAGDVGFTMTDTDNAISYSLKGGSWKYVQGGIAQTSVTARQALYNLSSKRVTDFRATFSLKPVQIGENGYVGAIFGRSTVNGTSGTSVRLNGKSVGLYSPEGTLLAEGETSLKTGELLQFTLIVNGSVLALYEGNDPRLILYYDGLTSRDGYFGWICDRAACELYSYNVYVPSGNVFVEAGAAYMQESVLDPALTDLELSGSAGGNYLTLRTGLSDFALSCNLQINRVNPVYRGYADIAFGVSAGTPHLSRGIVLRFNDLGRLSVFIDGVQVEKDLMTEITDASSCFVLLVYQDRTLQAWCANYRKEGGYTAADLKPLYTYRDTVLHAGTLAFYSRNAGVRFNALRAYGLSDGADYTSLGLYRDILLGEPLPPDPEVGTGYGGNYRNDFNGNSSLETLLRYSGACNVKNGQLTVNGFSPQNWDAGVAVATGIYRDFELTVRMKVQEMTTNGGFAAVEFHKSNAANNHQGSTLSLMLYPGGTCKLFAGNGILTDYGVQGAADAEGFYTLHMRVENGLLTFGLGGAVVTVAIRDLPNNNELTQGYISLNAGSNTGIFDYLEINVLGQ